MANSKMRKLGSLAALTLIAAGGLAACGDEDATETGTATAAARVEAARGSDQHLFNHAAEITARSAVIGSDRHLHNHAAEIAARSAVMGSDVHLQNQAAEIARSQAQPDDTSGAAGSDAGPNVWEAGNRAAAALGQG
jgi:hypothetical protein